MTRIVYISTLPLIPWDGEERTWFSEDLERVQHMAWQLNWKKKNWEKRRREGRSEVTGYLKEKENGLNIRNKMFYVGKQGFPFFGISLPILGLYLWWQVVTRTVVTVTVTSAPFYYISTLPFVFCLCTVATSSSLSLKTEEVFGCRKSSRNS